jgi:V8-like Glu-specific endopeptidase
MGVVLLGAFLGIILSAQAGESTPPNSPAPVIKLTEDQARAIVLIKGDNAEGTGFLIKSADGPTIVTNIHVISNNPNLRITTNAGTPIEALSLKGATDRDLVMIAVKDASFSYLELATDISGSVQVGDDLITPGDSEGGQVMLNTAGKVVGIGPDRIEFSNPIYHGNSGGPVFHVKSGKVIGVVTEAIKVDTSDSLDKTSFADRSSAIKSSMRYFGFRIDDVPHWEPYDWSRFQIETAFLDQFDKFSRSLDSYLNTSKPSDGATEDKKQDDNNQDAVLWQENEKIVSANNTYLDRISGVDTSQQMDALRELYQTINDLACVDVDAIKDPRNFYAFDQQRAKEEMAYRKALQVELDGIGDNVSRLGSMPRTNN